MVNLLLSPILIPEVVIKLDYVANSYETKTLKDGVALLAVTFNTNIPTLDNLSNTCHGNSYNHLIT